MILLTVFNEKLSCNPYLDYCFQAMNDLYKSSEWICFQEENMDDQDIQLYERNFIISLTTMLEKRRCKFDEDCSVSGLINGEIAKSLHEISKKAKDEYVKIKRKKKKDFSPSSCYVFPDFLIHESHSKDQNTWTTENQHIIIEAKTKHIDNAYSFFLDFLKLNFYLHELHFESAIYMIIRTSVSEIQDYLSKYEDEVDYLFDEAFNRLYFFVQEKIENEPIIYTIKKQ